MDAEQGLNMRLATEEVPHPSAVASQETLGKDEQQMDYEPDHANDITSTDEKETEMNRTTSNVSIAETLTPWREFMFVSIICLAQFQTQVGLGQVLSILHIIGDDFGLTNPGDLSWLIAGYSLTVGTFILMAGRLGDLFGYKRMLLIGFAWFALWSMIAGLAVYSNHVLFVFARVFQGIGPAIVLPNGLAILGASYKQGPRKAMVFALFGACAPVGSIAGAVFSGLFALAWWPWTFYSFAIALAMTTVVGFFVIPDPPPRLRASNMERQSLRGLAVELDLLGGLTGVLALVLINFAWNQSGVVGWKEPYVYVCLILGMLAVPAFFFIEMRIASAPLIPFEALSSDVGFVLACVACGWGCFGIWVYYIWQFLETLREASPLLASAYICPVAVFGTIAAVVTGILLGKLRPAWVMTIAMTCFTIGTILIATAPVHQTYWAQVFVSVAVAPFGMDMSFPAATLILSNAVSKEHQGIAASLVSTIVNYSISLSLGFAGTVEGNVNHGGKTRAEILTGYRGALYMGIGLSGTGMVISIIFLLKTYWRDRQNQKAENP